MPVVSIEWMTTTTTTTWDLYHGPDLPPLYNSDTVHQLVLVPRRFLLWWEERKTIVSLVARIVGRESDIRYLPAVYATGRPPRTNLPHDGTTAVEW